jgi:hypothetical protein
VSFNKLKRRATQIEKVLVETDRVAAQHLAPDLEQPRFEVIRGTIAARRRDQGFGGRQFLPVDFSRRG